MAAGVGVATDVGCSRKQSCTVNRYMVPSGDMRHAGPITSRLWNGDARLMELGRPLVMKIFLAEHCKMRVLQRLLNLSNPAGYPAAARRQITSNGDVIQRKTLRY